MTLVAAITVFAAMPLMMFGATAIAVIEALRVCA